MQSVHCSRIPILFFSTRSPSPVTGAVADTARARPAAATSCLRRCIPQRRRSGRCISPRCVRHSLARTASRVFFAAPRCTYVTAIGRAALFMRRNAAPQQRRNGGGGRRAPNPEIPPGEGINRGRAAAIAAAFGCCAAQRCDNFLLPRRRSGET